MFNLSDSVSGAMDKLCALTVTFLIFGLPSLGTTVTSALRSHDGLEEWGYVEVRPKAHLFWWLYKSPYRVENPSKPWPIILWLQGGPGASGIAYGNFEEVGPLDIKLKPRNSTWLQEADLLFVDNPVGTGYSYVEDTKLLVKTDKEAATDLTTLLIKIFNKNKSLGKSPLYIVGESYGGKFAVTLGLSALKAIEAGKLHVKLGGVALGNSWISPEDFVFSWGPLLKDVSRLDDNGLRRSNRIARKIKKQLEDGLFINATNSWRELQIEIFSSSNGVDIYNFLLDSWGDDSVSLSGMGMSLLRGSGKKGYSKYMSSLLRDGDEEIVKLLNGEIKEKLRIIPRNVTLQLQSDAVFDSFEVDFMKPRIDEPKPLGEKNWPIVLCQVDELLAKGVNVSVYNGQLDVICATKGVEAWLRKLKWEGLPNFLGKERVALYCGSEAKSKGFVKSYKNLRFYWILGAGHMVPIDQPCMALTMGGAITDSPAASS